jgi:hypothetical protein
MPEANRLAATIERWWPQTEGFLELGNSNAGTEGHNHVIKPIKQIKRVACGFRNQNNQSCASCCAARPAGLGELSAGRGQPRSSDTSQFVDRV